VLQVHYEDLVRQPAEVARRICDFLGETFEPGMLDFQSKTELVAARDRHLHARLQQPLSDSAVAVWRHRLSAVECFAIEACLHRELTQGGYVLRFAAHGWRPIFAMTAGLLRMLAPQIRRFVLFLQDCGVLKRNVYL